MMNEQHSILDRMLGMVEAWDDARDRRSIFLRCYSLMTGNMLSSIERGEFHDNDWVRELLHHFAEYYFRALDAYERGDPGGPAGWRAVRSSTARAPSRARAALGGTANGPSSFCAGGRHRRCESRCSFR